MGVVRVGVRRRRAGRPAKGGTRGEFVCNPEFDWRVLDARLRDGNDGRREGRARVGGEGDGVFDDDAGDDAGGGGGGDRAVRGGGRGRDGWAASVREARADERGEFSVRALGGGRGVDDGGAVALFCEFFA